MWIYIPALCLSMLTTTFAADPLPDCKGPLDILFVVGSKSGKDWGVKVTLLKLLIEKMNITEHGVHVGIVGYALSVVNMIPLNHFKEAKPLIEALAYFTPTGGGADIGRGLNATRDHFIKLGRPNVPKFAVLLANEASSDPIRTASEAAIAKSEGVRIMALALGTTNNVTELVGLVSSPELLTPILSFTSFKQLLNNISNTICTWKPKITATTTIKPTTTKPVEPNITATTTIKPTTTEPGPDCSKPVDLMFLVHPDSADDWTGKKTFLKKMAELVSDGGIRSGVVLLGSKGRRTVDPRGNASVLQDLIDKLQPVDYGSNTALGLRTVDVFLAAYGRSNVPKVGFVITNKKSVIPQNTATEFRTLKQANVTLMALGVGNQVDLKELQSLVTSHQMLFRASNVTSAMEQVDSIRDSICSVNKMPSPTTPPTPESTKGCREPADVLFLLDGSDSISVKDWAREVGFVSQMLEKFDVQPSGVKVGVIVLRSIVGDTLTFNPSRDALRSLIYRLEHPRFDANTAMGISKARQMFSNEGRPNIHKLAVIITNNKSKLPSKTISEANLAKGEGVHMTVFDVGNVTTDAELNGIATSTKDVFKIPDFQGLKVTKTIENYLQDLCTGWKKKIPQTA